MKKGVSDLIAFVLSILFGVVMITLVLTVLNPTLNRAKDSGALTEAFQNLPLLDSAIREVASEAQVAKRTINLIVNNGEYEVDAANNYIIFTYDPSEDMLLSGRRGDIYIERGHVFTDFFNNYVENSDGRNAWISITGKWNVTNYKYSGEGGLAYHNVGQLDTFKFSGTITNISGVTGGQIFAVPGSPTNLVGFWSFDNGTGSKTYDWSGNSNNGTITDASWTAGIFGNALQFDGANDYVSTAFNPPNLNIPQTITIEAWVKQTGPNKAKYIVDKYLSAGSTGYTFRIGAGNNLLAQLGNGSSNTVATTTTISKDVWTHVVFTFNGMEYSFYINGNLDSSGTLSLNITSNTDYLVIGAGYPGDTTNNFNGTIDEVKIWNRSLTASEISSEYQLSTKKLKATGDIDFVSQSTNVTIVLANPDGKTNFDDIKVNDDDKELKLIIPYSNIDLNGTGRFTKGEHQVTIEHMGTNSTLSKSVIQISSA